MVYFLPEILSQRVIYFYFSQEQSDEKAPLAPEIQSIIGDTFNSYATENLMPEIKNMTDMLLQELENLKSQIGVK